MMRRRNQKANPDPVVDLQEQLSLLTLENERLKAILAENGLDDTLNLATPVAKDFNATKRTPTTPKTVIKGCSCRGNCSTRVCGCVKRNVPCAESCRCGDEMCQNQEEDKENMAGPMNEARAGTDQPNSKTTSNSPTKADTDTKKRKVGPASKTRVARDEHRRLFSPGPTSKVFNCNMAEFVATPLSFGEDAESATGENNTNANEDETDDKTTAETKNRRNKRETLKVAGPQRKLRSLSNQELETEADSVKKVRNKRSVSAGRENAGAPKVKPAKSLASLINGAKPPLRRGAAAKPRGSRASTGDENNEENATNGRSTEERNPKSKKTAKANNGKREMKKTKGSGKKVDRPNPNENEESENYNEDDETEEKSSEQRNIPAETNVGQVESKERPADHQHEVEIKFEIEGVDTEGNTEEENVENPGGISQNSDNYTESDSSPMSERSSGNSALHPEDFDPMKPRHKLSRSPVIPHQDRHHYSQLDISERPLPMPVRQQESVELPPPAELNEPVVDWEKHQAERIRCRKCGRGFYPYRIKKHEASCHKV